MQNKADNLTPLVSLDLDELDAAQGGGAFGRAWDTISNTFWQVAPGGTIKSTAEVAPGLAEVAIQSNRRNALLDELSGPNAGTSSNYNGAFNRYHEAGRR